MLETVYNENERLGASVRKASDEVKGDVKVSAAVVSRYTGVYKMGPQAG